MARVLVYSMPDGMVHVTHPNPAFLQGDDALSQEQLEQFVEMRQREEAADPASAVFGGTNFHWVDESTLPSDRRDRGKWRLDGNGKLRVEGKS